MTDYRVVIGNGECNISSLSDNLLTCRPPYDEPEISANNPCGILFNSILVYAGNAGPFLHGCVRYETMDLPTVLYDTSDSTVMATTDSTTVRSETDIVPIIVGLVVGLSVLIILIVIVVAVVIYKRRGRRRQVANDNYDDIVEMPPVSAENRASERSKSTVNDKDEPENDTGLYYDIDHYDVINPSYRPCDDAGYMIPVDDGSPGHTPHYVETIPSPSPSPAYYNDAKQEPITTDSHQTG